MKSPLKWVGGKSRLVETILPLIPQHAHYAEAFFGAGWLFFRKPESRYESINDTPQIRTIFADFRVQEAKTTYTCAKDGSTNAAELLIMNYEPKPGMLRLF